MAGFLDSNFGKILFGHTAMMKDRELKRQGLLYQAEADKVGQARYGGTMQPQTETYNSQTGQTTLTGGEQEQGSLMGGTTPAQFRTNIGAIPAYRKMSGQLQQQQMANDAAWNRNMYNQTNLSANDIRNQQNTDRAYLTDQIDQGVQNLEIGNQLIAGLPKLEGTKVIDYGNMNATQDNQMLMAFAKIINPGEAVGVDEKGAIQGAAWMPEFLMRGIAAVQSGGEMPDALRNQIAQQYTQALQMNMQKVEQLRQMNSNISGKVYSPQPQNYRGMYTGGQVGNTGIFGQDTPEGRTPLRKVGDKEADGIIWSK